jgi:multidrug efflux pump subunit AcrA (membrane-fusion protein)
MQDMVAEALNMERGVKKSETGLDHLERNDFILQKQEKEKKRLEAEKRKIQSERDVAKNQARHAMEEKDEAEKKAQTAKTELSNAESKVTEKQAEIENLDRRITSKEVMLDGLVTETAALRKEKYSDKSAGSDGWKDSLLGSFSANLMRADRRIGYCLDAIKGYACSGTGCRGGRHGDCFWDEEAYTIKNVMTSFAEALQATLREIGSWLVWLANAVHRFNDRELYRADKEVRDVADGRYDWRIERIDRGQGGGISR